MDILKNNLPMRDDFPKNRLFLTFLPSILQKTRSFFQKSKGVPYGFFPFLKIFKKHEILRVNTPPTIRNTFPFMVHIPFLKFHCRTIEGGSPCKLSKQGVPHFLQLKKTVPLPSAMKVWTVALPLQSESQQGGLVVVSLLHQD